MSVEDLKNGLKLPTQESKNYPCNKIDCEHNVAGFCQHYYADICIEFYYTKPPVFYEKLEEKKENE